MVKLALLSILVISCDVVDHQDNGFIEQCIPHMETYAAQFPMPCFYDQNVEDEMLQAYHDAWSFWNSVIESDVFFQGCSTWNQDIEVVRPL